MLTVSVPHLDSHGFPAAETPPPLQECSAARQRPAGGLAAVLRACAGDTWRWRPCVLDRCRRGLPGSAAWPIPGRQLKHTKLTAESLAQDSASEQPLHPAQTLSCSMCRPCQCLHLLDCLVMYAPNTPGQYSHGRPWLIEIQMPNGT